jgi:hypothetical protein
MCADLSFIFFYSQGAAELIRIEPLPVDCFDALFKKPGVARMAGSSQWGVTVSS